MPDLGADLVRVFSVDNSSLSFTAITPLSVVAGSGPRHAAFLETDQKTYLYLVSELANTITGFQVTEDGGELSFTQFYNSSTHGLGETPPSGAAAAEIHVSPDSNFLLVSSRNESTLSIPNFDPSNSTEIPSDLIITFSIDQATGNLTKVQEYPAGGSFPRQFSISKDGTQIAVGLQVRTYE